METIIQQITLDLAKEVTENAPSGIIHDIPMIRAATDALHCVSM